MVQENTKRVNPFDGHFVFCILPSMHTTEWIIESGASTHICANPELLYTTYDLESPTRICLPDGSSKTISHAGKVRLNKSVLLDEVLYVPGFTHNLLSVAQLVKTLDIKCTFHPTHCIFQRNNTDQVVGIQKLKGNLYVMDTVTEKYYLSFFNPREMDVRDWHIFMGHPSITAKKHMKIAGTPFHRDALEVLENCEICYRAKQTRDPFPTLDRRSNALFEIVHEMFGAIWRGKYLQC